MGIQIRIFFRQGGSRIDVDGDRQLAEEIEIRLLPWWSRVRHGPRIVVVEASMLFFLGDVDRNIYTPTMTILPNEQRRSLTASQTWQKNTH